MILHGHNIYICYYSAGSIESDIHFKMSGKRGSTLRVDFHFIIRTSSAGLKPGACSASSFNRFIPRSQVLRTCCRPQRGRGSRVLVPQKKHKLFVRLCFLATWSGKRGSNPRLQRKRTAIVLSPVKTAIGFDGPQRGRGSRVLVPQKKHKLFVRLCFLATWSGKRGSNPRPSAWEADALPTELLPRCFHQNDKFMNLIFTTY